MSRVGLRMARMQQRGALSHEPRHTRLLVRMLDRLVREKTQAPREDVERSAPFLSLAMSEDARYRNEHERKTMGLERGVVFCGIDDWLLCSAS